MVSYVYLLSLLAVLLLPVRIGYDSIAATTDSKPAFDLPVATRCSASATGSAAVHQEASSMAYVEAWKIVELTISRVADDFIDDANNTDTANTNANDEKLVMNRDAIPADEAFQCARIHSQGMTLAQTCNTVDFGRSEVKSESPDIRNDNAQPTCKENEAPHSSEPAVDHSIEFADWKGSGNPSRPKCAGPPCDVDQSGQEDSSASDVSTDRSRGICPGMGAWGQN